MIWGGVLQAGQMPPAQVRQVPGQSWLTPPSLPGKQEGGEGVSGPGALSLEC